MNTLIKKGDNLSAKQGRVSSNGLYFRDVIKMTAKSNSKSNYDYRSEVNVEVTFLTSSGLKSFKTHTIFTDSVDIVQAGNKYDIY